MTPWVKRLLIANVAVFFLQYTVAGVGQLLALYPPQIVYRPWTIVTYMFAHGGIGHIFFNMLGLWVFGPRVEAKLGSQRFIVLYLLSGITGALFSIVLAWGTPVVGASAAIYGVTLAYAWFWPRDQIYIWGVLPVQVRWLVVIYTVMNLFSGLQPGVANFAHLGGFAGAFIYLKWIARNPALRRWQAKSAPKVADRTLGNWQRIDPQKVHEVNRDELNRVLDKVSATGLSSLTPDERRFLASFVPPDDRVPEKQ